MNGNKLATVIAFSCVFLCCPIDSGAQEYIFMGDKGIFPQLLGDLTWKYDESTMRKRLPGSNVEDVKYGKDDVDSIYTGVVLPYFGDAIIDVVHKSNRVIQFIKISTNETREQCLAEAKNMPITCRNIYGKVLIEIRNDLLLYIQSKHGEGIVKSVCEDENGFKICEKSFMWSTKTAKLVLGMYKDDDGSWIVSLYIGRPRDFLRIPEPVK